MVVVMTMEKTLEVMLSGEAHGDDGNDYDADGVNML